MNWPGIYTIISADHEQLARWFRFLPITETEEEREKILLISKRLNELGGMTREVSEKIGWRRRELSNI